MTQEFKILTNYDQFVCNYTEVAHKGKNNWTKCTSSGPVKLYSHVYDFRDPVPTEDNQMIETTKLTLSSSIPFDGEGRYELNDGRVVYLSDNAKCSERDNNIKNANGSFEPWKWEKDGTIVGLGYNDHSGLYLKRKMSLNESRSYYIKREEEELKAAKRKLRAFAKMCAKYLLTASIAFGGVYAVKNFDYVKATCGEYFQQYIPKITMERPEILK